MRGNDRRGATLHDASALLAQEFSSGSLQFHEHKHKNEPRKWIVSISVHDELVETIGTGIHGRVVTQQKKRSFGILLKC